MIFRFISDDLAALDGLQQGIVQISGKPGPFLQSFVKTPLQRTGVPSANDKRNRGLPEEPVEQSPVCETEEV